MGAFGGADMGALEADYVVHRYWEAADPERLLADVGPRIRAVLTRGDLGVGSDVMRRLPRLEIVACFGVGVDAIDLGYARAHGVRVANTPDVLTDAVADMAMALLLAAARRIPDGDRYVRSGAWLARPMALTSSVSGKRLGILGLGRVGRAVARRAAGFDISVAYCAPRRKEDVPLAWHSDARALAAAVDFLVICAAGGEATRGLVDAAVLDALGPSGILVNVSRGSIVDEPALLSALREKRIAAAGLDVFLNEPSIDPEFARLENVVLQPHQGSATVETRAAIDRLARRNLAAHFAGEPLPTPVV
jgi:D-3-phosphoglycerate dehydrogenase